MAENSKRSSTSVSQEDIIRAQLPGPGTLLIPKSAFQDDGERTFAPAAALRAMPGSRLALTQPMKDPGSSLQKLGLQNIDRLARREVTKEPHSTRGMFARLGALGMAAAYFSDERTVEDAHNELADEYDFVPNFYLSLPTAIRGEQVDATKGRLAPEPPPWFAESGVLEAHARQIRGAGVLVGVLDTGVDADHVEMSAQEIIFRYVSFFPNSPYWPPRDVRGFDSAGHGTHVSGIIAGRNIGVAPEARLIVASVIESETSRTSLVRVAYGLDWMLRQFSSPACEHRPAVLNMSLGFPSSLVDQEEFKDRLRVIQRLLRTLNQANVLPIVAVGNDGPGKFGYPAGFEEALAVGAIDKDKQVADFSGSTPPGTGPTKPDIYGYGVDVYSSVERDYLGRSSYQTMSGTSMAAPYVTGIAALMLCQRPGLSTANLKAELINNGLQAAGLSVPVAAFRRNGATNAAPSTSPTAPSPPTSPAPAGTVSQPPSNNPPPAAKGRKSSPRRAA